MDSGEVTFRVYTPEDLERCAMLAVQAWPMRGSSGPEQSEPSGFETWIGSTGRSSTWTEVAVVSGEVVGFLFGSVDKMKKEGDPLGKLGDMFWMFGEFFSGNRHRWRITLRTALSFFFTQFRLEVNRPDADADISLLIVDSRFRGRGIGKGLVDRFIRMARDAGAYAVTLFTDDKISNWKFYELYGFKKVVSFYDGISTYFAGERANAIYYVLELDKK
jgi:ribosomal protein S18 acetylase RimI-like enzyme